jgi:hypothetical protein
MCGRAPFSHEIDTRLQSDNRILQESNAMQSQTLKMDTLTTIQLLFNILYIVMPQRGRFHTEEKMLRLIPVEHS